MKMVRKRSGIVMKIAIFVILVGLLAVAGTVIYTNLYENHFFADRKFEELSRSYYENSLYENFITEHDGENLSEAFSVYKNGFTVKLRQILNYEFLEHNQNYRTYFETDNYSCDTNKSYVKFTAHEPYGKKDYDAEFNLVCDKK
jgi:hypothetical protein